MPLDPFVYHRPTDTQAARMDRLTGAMRAVWQILTEEIRACEEKQQALQKLRECRMWANAGILFGDALDVEPTA